LSSQRPSHELSLEETFSLTIDVYFRNFVTFLMPFLIAGFTSALLSMPILNYLSQMPQIDPTGPPDIVWSQLWDFLVTLISLAFILGLISWIISTIVSGICVKCASDFIEKGKTSLEESFIFALYKLPSLLVATLIVGIITVIGFIALIVPGIIFHIMFFLVVPVIVIENIGALASLSRSRELVSNRWLKTFLLALIIYLILGIVAFVVSLIVTPLGIYGHIFGNIVTAFIEPILPISITIYYYSMYAKEEQRKIPPPPPPPF